MDCQTARDHFSEYLDGRLLPDARSTLDDHLGRCAVCQQEWRLYGRVFAAVSELTEEPALRPFVAPRERPGSLDRSIRPLPSISWRRVRAAAAIVVMLAVSHVLVFEFASGSGEDVGPVRGFNAAAFGGQALAPVVGSDSSTFRRRLSDHVDATNLLARQIVYLPDDASDEAKGIVEAQLEVLDPHDLCDDFERNKSQLGVLAGTANLYLDFWRQLAAGLEQDLAFAARPTLVAAMRDRVTKSNLVRVLRPARVALASEPTGLSWREPAQAIRLFSNERLGVSPVVKSYLIAHEKLLKANYLDAAQAFEGFSEQHPGSRLLALSRYLQAESYRRVGFADHALRVASQLSFGRPAPVILNNDPLGTLLFVARRSIPLSVFGDGAVVPRPETRGLFQPFAAPAPLQWSIEVREFGASSNRGGGIRLVVRPTRGPSAEQRQVRDR